MLCDIEKILCKNLSMYLNKHMIDYGGSLQKLTTPEIKNQDPVFPGENWFFYWKSSPSLWAGKLREYQGVEPLFVPIYWALHSEYINQYDFGHSKPETDLLRLAKISSELGKQLVFVMPIGPAPFLPNGGIPSYVARSNSTDSDGLYLSAWDKNSKLNKFYSFYDPNVFQSFRKFCWNLGQFMSQNGLDLPVYGLDAYKLDKGKPVSFFDDYSLCFDKGFNQYIKKTQSEDPKKIEALIENPTYEKELKREYKQTVYSLYLETCIEMFSGNWSGVIEQNFLGTASVDLFRRSLNSWQSQQNIFRQLFLGQFYNLCPNSILIESKYTKSAIGECLRKVVNHYQITHMLDSDYYEDESSLSFHPLHHFHIFWDSSHEDSLIKKIKKSGLLNFLDRDFSWQYHVFKDDHGIEDIDNSSVYIAIGEFLTEKDLREIFKFFLNGQKVLLDIHGMPEKLKKKLDIFIVENSLEQETINFLCKLEKISLGEGLLISFNSEKLSKEGISKTSSFWKKIVHFLDLSYLPVEVEQGVFYHWSARGSNPLELNYEQMRRVSFYNPTSYKRKAFIKSSPKFAFIRSIDPQKASFKSTPLGLELEMLPGGVITLDFGYYEA